MKQYPRIYSLSTLGLIHHQEFDYLFHPFRTDFIGESGSGKSMIADLIQLILVGSDAFESATKATGKREPEGMVLTEVGHVKTMGYAFLNIEMQPQKYLIVGSYIETDNKNTQAFIIQQSFDKDNFIYLNNPISCRDLIKDDRILPLDKLKDLLSERGLFCQSWLKLKKYHELLYKQNIVPIDLAANNRQLKDYAEILQSFSRGKLVDTQKSNTLKDFLFGKDAANTIYESYKTAVKDMEATIGEYGVNLKEIARVTEKQAALLELRKSRDERDRLQKDWIEKQLLYAYQETETLRKEIIDIITGYTNAKQHYLVFYELLDNEISYLEQGLPDLDLQQQAANDKYYNSWTRYKEIEKVENWLQACNCTLQQLQDKYAENTQIRSYKTTLISFIQTLRSQQLEKAFDDIEQKDAIENINQFLNDSIINLRAQIETKEGLKRFSDVNAPDSFAYWAIQKKRAFSLEEESAIIEFQKLSRQKSLDKSDYLPSPDEFMDALEIIEKDGDGFWINLKGIRRFVPYTQKQVFNTTNTQTIVSYFSNYSDSLEQEIIQHRKMLSDYGAMQKILLNLSSPTEALAAYNNREKITTYPLIDSLNIGENEFNKALDTYKNKVKIEELHSEAEQSLKDIQKKITDSNTSISVYKSYQGVERITNEDFIVQLANHNEFEHILEEIVKSYELMKENVRSLFRQAIDKIEFVNQNQTEIQPKLYGISGLEAKFAKYEKHQEELEKAKRKYQQLYDILSDNLTSNHYIQEPSDEHSAYLKAETNYSHSYKNIIAHFITSEAYRLEEEDNLSELAKNLLPEAFHDALLSDQSEGAIIDTIATYLHRINDKNRQLNIRKIQKIKDLLHLVDIATSEQENTIRRIDNFLKNETSITGGYKARLKKSTSTLFPREWMNKFQDSLEETSNNFTTRLAEKIDLEQMITTAFQDSGGHYSAQITVQKLLDPSVYYELAFNMESESGRINKGSTGQTYAAIALLCIARLSVMDKEEGKKQQPAVRIMPIDEAEGLGSNYDMLYDIAKAYDYQIISLSIGPIGRFRDGEQYLYILHKNMETEAAVNYTPMPILCEADKSAIGNSIEL